MAWLADDPHPGDRTELQRVLADAMAGNAVAVADLADRMGAGLIFGTAGLRGPLRAGPAGMNAAVIRRAAAGIAAHLRATAGPGAVVVVGFDARHRSAEFAADAAAVLAAAGCTVLLADRPLPTPVTAFAVRQLGAAAGLHVTASHNPAQDNGLKVYLAGGVQLVGPDDTRIEAAIAAVRSVHAVPADPAAVRPWPVDLVERYAARATGCAPAGARQLRIALTPMHGVGGDLAVRVLHDAGFTDVHVVREQAVPDADFPTVPFPNPEEAGATDLLLALAAEVDADLAVALDPDADRCAIGVRTGDGWRMLTGDETGVLLADLVLGILDRTIHPDPLVATTVVSSQQLRSVAAAAGVRYDETLTGFKWIVRAGDGEGTGLVFGYEEALGLCVDPDGVRDKDGISAAVVAAALAARLRAEGRDLPSRLDDLARQHGMFVTDQLSVRVDDVAVIAGAMRRLRASRPDRLLGDPAEYTDLLPRTDGVVLRTSTARAVVRPSGTEPKLKAYLEVSEPVPAGTAPEQVRRTCRGRLRDLRDEVAGLLDLPG
ncbi:phospho-sugar mutase [Nakamurella leprariae]|uniref:Phospho-sugar mutase n=1 Tax=Nakamurella leprariae TaxID=2803911 RepID=A0A939C1Y6_9ACTN|nr:phospho-sugar mutase [Nakamurella leprariae]